jgi:hypothetical protein
MPPFPDAALSALEIASATNEGNKTDRRRRPSACEMNAPVFNI